ncbi:unnamed protein product [Discosporangium mesarthrocarpum]
MAAKGFGKETTPPPKGFGTETTPTPPEVTVSIDKGSTLSRPGTAVSWEKEYKAYIKRTGKYLCSMSWDGYEQMGRGAIFANYDDAMAKDKLNNEADKFGGVPSMYIPLKEFESMQAAKPNEADDLNQILARVRSYSPEKEFVVVFQAAGMMGTDVVKPNITPPEMAKHVVTQEKIQGGDVGQRDPSTAEDGVIDVNAVEV